MPDTKKKEEEEEKVQAIYKTEWKYLQEGLRMLIYVKIISS